MPLTPGTRLGPYEVTAQIGAGGMGEVYRAFDTNLKRQVAIKVLPESLAADPDRLARFQREAEVLAQLNHPNIAAIYGLEKSVGHTALVMELVEGLTLADRIVNGPLPLDEAWPIAKQIAEALEAAHEHGIIHRDLKPANIKVRDEGTVKVLDFGLAKAFEGPAKGGHYVDLSVSPTITTPAMTQVGVILGTAAYMSPEQAKGKPVDRRTDVWAFGCVLYEMLTGQRLFEGETVTETLAAVLTKEPEWSRVPRKVRTLLQRCLQRDPRHRVRDIAEAMAWSEGVTDGTPSAQGRRWVWPLVAATASAAALALAFLRFSAPAQVPLVPMRFETAAPADITPQAGSRFAISPDSRWFAFVGAGPDGVDRVWVRAIDSAETRPLPGTEVSLASVLAWSPDSRQIAFVGQNALKKIQVSGGPPETLCEIDRSRAAVGATWNADGAILFGTGNGGVYRASAAGGPCSPVTMRAGSEVQHVYPDFLPDGRRFLYVANSVDRATNKETGALYVGSLDVSADKQERRAVVQTGYKSAFIPALESGDVGTLLFVRDRTLMSQAFDTTRLTLVGDAVPVAEPIGTLFADAAFDASSNALVYRTNAIERYQLTWFDSAGRPGDAVGEPAFMRNVSLSPDGKRAAYDDLLNGAIWVLDVERGTRTTLGTGSNPIWSPDGSRVIFAEPRSDGFALVQKSASGVGEAEVLLRAPGYGLPEDWSPDGSLVLYMTLTGQDLWALPLTGEKKPFPVAQTTASEADGRVSPDGRLVAYTSSESGGKFEVYVRPLPRSAGDRSVENAERVTVSRGGGNRMFAWRADSKELWYYTADKKIMAVNITTVPALRAGEPKLLFQARDVFASVSAGIAAATDGKRFLMALPVEGAARAPFVFVLNWQQALGQRGL